MVIFLFEKRNSLKKNLKTLKFFRFQPVGNGRMDMKNETELKKKMMMIKNKDSFILKSLTLEHNQIFKSDYLWILL